MAHKILNGKNIGRQSKEKETIILVALMELTLVATKIATKIAYHPVSFSGWYVYLRFSD